MKMKKIVIKEFDKTLLGVDIMLYSFFVVVGFMLYYYRDVEVIRPIEYVAPIFYMFAFMSLVAYFINRRPDDYEFLFFGLINIIVGTYVLVNEYYSDSCFIIGSAVLIYSVANILNKGYHTKKLIQKNDVNFYVKLSVTFLITLLGLLVISDLFSSESITNLVLSYYFMGFGLLSLFEPLLMVLTKNPKVERYLESLSETDVKVESKPKKKKTTIKEIQKKKPVKKVSKKEEE